MLVKYMKSDLFFYSFLFLKQKYPNAVISHCSSLVELLKSSRNAQISSTNKITKQLNLAPVYYVKTVFISINGKA